METATIAERLLRYRLALCPGFAHARLDGNDELMEEADFAQYIDMAVIALLEHPDAPTAHR
ncbi:hypothetical protein ACWD25_04590 [Streptomyces sp. NPDC002920]